jgi:type VI secretion system protein VasD
MSTFILGVLLILLLSGCASSQMKVQIRSALDLNRSETHRALPVLVKLYQLREKDRFEQATFREIWKDDAAVLGDNMITQREITVAPGASTNIALKRSKEARYIGLTAIFRDPVRGRWRLVKRLARNIPYMPVVMTVGLQGNRLYFINQHRSVAL